MQCLFPLSNILPKILRKGNTEAILTHHTLAIQFVNFYQVTVGQNIYVIGQGGSLAALVYAIEGEMKLLKCASIVVISAVLTSDAI